jgi:hypothetical protein
LQQAKGTIEALEQRVAALRNQWEERYSTQEKRVQEVRLIAEMEREFLMADANQSQRPKFMTLLQDGKEWLMARNVVLVTFLMTIANAIRPNDIGNDQRRKMYIETAVGCTYKAANLRYVSVSSFISALLTMMFSHSTSTISIMASSIASGSISLLRTVVNELSTSDWYFPQSDVDIAFDNQQLLRRSWLSRLGKQFAEVFTMVICFALPADMQFKKDYSPRNTAPMQDASILALRTTPSDLKVLFDNYRASAFSVYLNLSKKVRDSKITNEISKRYKFHNFDMSQVMVKRAKTASPSYSIESASLSNKDDPNLSSMAIKSSLAPRASIPFYMMEPIFVNPSSFAAISSILSKIKDVALKSGREWIYITVDGVPYRRIRTLMYKNPESYNWIRLRYGPLHEEMNMERALIDFFWEPLISICCRPFGYTTPAATAAFKRAVDHHKTRDHLLIISKVLGALIAENFLKVTTNPSLEHFLAFMEKGSTSDQSFFVAYKFLQYTQSLFMFHDAVRQNNYTKLRAARRSFEPLFWTGRHPIMAPTICEEEREFLEAPLEVQEQMASSFAVARNKHDPKYQGKDALLEETNKAAKTWAPLAPNSNAWHKILYRLGHLENIRQSIWPADNRTRSIPDSTVEEDALRTIFVERNIGNFEEGRKLPSLHDSFFHF